MIEKIKKILLGTMLGTTVLLGNQQEQIIDNIGKNYSTYKTNKVVYKTYDKKLKVEFGISEISTKNGKNYLLYMYFPEAKIMQVINPSNFRLYDKTGKTETEEFKKIFKKYVKLLKSIKNQKYINNIDKNSGIIILNNKLDKNKPTMLIFIDPECPFCKKEFIKIYQTRKEILKKYNIILVLTPLVTLDNKGKVILERSLHPYSLEKSVKILNNINNKMNSEKKLEVLFNIMINNNGDYNNTGDYNKNRIKVINNYNRFLKTGIIKGTPTNILLEKEETEKIINKLK